MKKFYQQLLLKGLIFQDATTPSFFRKMVRFFYSSIMTQIIELSLKLKLRKLDIRVASRHSSKTGESFNLFASDLDLSTYVSLPDEMTCKILRAHIALWKKVFPFIGELEIYSFEERGRLTQLFLMSEPYYSTLRKIRKIDWMETAYREAPSAYHRHKALRSIQQCLNFVGPHLKAQPTGNFLLISPYLEKWILSRFGSCEIKSDLISHLSGKSFFNFYMGGEINVKEKGQIKSGYLLSPEASLILFSIIPSDSYCDSTLELAINKMRSTYPKLSEIWGALAELELITVLGVSRSHETEMPWASYALKVLSDCLGQFKLRNNMSFSP